MSAATQVSLAEYLHTEYEPDCEYITIFIPPGVDTSSQLSPISVPISERRVGGVLPLLLHY